MLSGSECAWMSITPRRSWPGATGTKSNRVRHASRRMDLLQRLNEIDEVAAGVVKDHHAHRAHGLRLASELHAAHFQRLVLGIDVCGEKRRRRDACLPKSCVVNLRRFEAHRLEHQFHSLSPVGRGDRQPAIRTHRDVFLLYEANLGRVELQCLGLVVHQDSGEPNLHSSSSGWEPASTNVNWPLRLQIILSCRRRAWDLCSLGAIRLAIEAYR